MSLEKIVITIKRMSKAGHESKKLNAL